MRTHQTEVYIILINNKTVHSVVANEDIAKKVVADNRGISYHRFPLISVYDRKIAATEGYDGYPRPYYEGNTDTDQDDFAGGDRESDRSADDMGDGSDRDMGDSNDRGFDDAETRGDDDLSLGGGEDTPDVVCMDVPLTIRLLEYAREEAGEDADLHKVAANLVSLGIQLDEVLTMDHYEEVMDGVEGDGSVGDGGEGGSDGGPDGDWAAYDTDTNMDTDIDSRGGDDIAYSSPDIDTDGGDAPPRRTEMYRGGRMNEGKVTTFAEFLRDLPETGTTTVPTLKDTFAKRKKIPVVHTRHEVGQRGDDNSPFVIKNETTDKA